MVDNGLRAPEAWEVDGGLKHNSIEPFYLCCTKLKTTGKAIETWETLPVGSGLEYTIYVLVDPREPDIARYVGCTSDIKRRLAEHHGVNNRGRALDMWLKELDCEGVKPEMVRLAEVDGKHAKEAESYYIEDIGGRDTWQFTLLNDMLGGSGLRCDDERVAW